MRYYWYIKVSICPKNANTVAGLVQIASKLRPSRSSNQGNFDDGAVLKVRSKEASNFLPVSWQISSRKLALSVTRGDHLGRESLVCDGTLLGCTTTHQTERLHQRLKTCEGVGGNLMLFNSYSQD